MPAKKTISNKKQTSKKATTSSLRAPKGRVNLPRKVASSSSIIAKSPRNDKKAAVRSLSLSAPVYSLAGRSAGTLALPKEIFGQKVNKKLLAQAIRVYSTNQKSLTGSTKTRGEVEGSTAKIFRQKGTGRARHGAIRAPIFVGGGIALGPKPRKVRLAFPQSMKRAALLSALSSKALSKQIIALSGMEKASGKTKEIVQLLGQVASIKGQEKKTKKQVTALIVTDGKMDNVLRGVRNIPGVEVLPISLMNAFEVVRHEILLLTKEAVEKIGRKETLDKEKKELKKA